MSTRSEHHQTVPLSVLLKRELANEKIESPEIVHGQASQSKKGKDFTLVKTEYQRVVGDGISTYSVFALFDGHNGSTAAIYSKENLLNNVLVAIPSDLNRDEWIAALPMALVAGFVKTDKDFQERAQMSGTTVTFVIIEGWVITVAFVGDSNCILEVAKGCIYYLSADHRLDCNEEDRLRITTSWGEVGCLNTGGGAEIGPLRCWPGGLCLSRSIGDRDVGEYILPVPYVKQVKLHRTSLRHKHSQFSSGCSQPSSSVTLFSFYPFIPFVFRERVDVATHSDGSCKIIFKKGDDIHQDQLVVQMVFLMKHKTIHTIALSDII